MTVPADLVLCEDVMPLGQLLIRATRRDPGKEALIFPDTRWTYAELMDRSWDVARGLIALGVQPGDRVGFLMTNHPDLVATFFGITLSGATIVPLNARYRTAELHELIEDADLVALLTHDSADAHVNFTALLHEALPGLAEAADPRALSLPDHPMLRSVVMMGRREPAGMLSRRAFEALAAETPDAAVIARVEAQKVRDVAMMLYTSGTTSAPRGALITHEADVRVWHATGKVFGTTPEDRHWSALPLYHVTALGCMTWVLSFGATFISDYSFDAGRTVEVLERERVTEFYPAYQPVQEDVFAHPRFAEADVSSIRVFANVAPPEVLAKFQSRIPHATLLTVYGGTEGGPVTITRRDDPVEDRLNTCGRCQDGLELRIVDQETGAALGPGERGIIQFRGYNTLSGYHKSPRKNAESMLPGGWVTMMDLGVMDEKGQVLFLGRAKETLKVGGENVSPQEVEAHLSTHPAVKLAQIVGIPDPRLVEVPAAFVELLPGVQATEEELIAHCKGRIASFKVPRLVRFVQPGDWPMSATKIQRFALRDRLLEELREQQEVPA